MTSQGLVEEGKALHRNWDCLDRLTRCSGNTPSEATY